MKSLLTPIEELEDSAPLGPNCNSKTVEAYIQDSMPAYEVRVTEAFDTSTYAIHVAIPSGGARVSIDFDCTVRELKDLADQLIERIQEELDEDPEEHEPTLAIPEGVSMRLEEAEASRAAAAKAMAEQQAWLAEQVALNETARTEPYTPKIWSKKLAEKAMRMADAVLYDKHRR